MNRLILICILALSLFTATALGDGQMGAGGRNCPDPNGTCICPTETDPNNPCPGSGRPEAAGEGNADIRVVIARIIEKIFVR